jgi:imidazolonepropionase-like amidohydrolase/Tol biopolymer transport system component
MDRDGSHLRQVTDESFRLLNNPVFTPDGEYIIARKHFVKTRSLGAGEMWQYHVSGGQGVQLTEKRDWQHDAGEPDVSPDGRYLYYSQDVSPGERFEYNRDPYGTIYAIQRLDLETGETMRLVAGPGGATTPQISPDGKTLAFVRRVGLKTVLFVKDLATGNERPLFDRLDRDAQETWAIFGVYPGYGWTPDSRFIVITARGRFWKVAVATGAAEEIPFSAEVTQTLTEPLRFPVRVGSPEFDIHVVRHTRVSPDGRRVVFQALGKLYLANTDGTDRRRLTDSEKGFEFQPAWSPDGNRIAFTTWRDDRTGGITVVDLAGGQVRELELPGGHYFDPAWSPDGEWLVYRRGGGTWLRGFRYSADPGIYLVPAAGGEPRFVTKEGRKPHFSRDGQRLTLLSREGENRALISVDLNGKDRRVLATSPYAVDMVLSPDERWIAFRERYQVYVAPFPHTGKPLALSPKMKSVPVKRVSRDSGFEVHWSGDSRTLYWTLGADLFSRPLKHCFSFVPGAPDTLPPLPGVEDSEVVHLGWTAAADTPAGSRIALTGARIITMDTAGVIANGTILIADNRIRAVGPATEVPLPPGTHTIDVSGKTIIPGLVDVHAHMRLNWDGLTSEQNWVYLVNLAFGVTTTHDPSNNTELVFANSELQKAGKLLAPRIFSTGTILYGAETASKAEINSLADARSHLRRLKAFGAFTVKSYNQPRREQRQQVLQAARELRLMVLPEGGSTFQHNLNMIVDGHTGIEHSLPVSPLYRDVLRLYGASDVGYTPTLIVSYGGLWGENYWYQHQKVFEHERLLAFTPRELLDQKRRRMHVEDEDYNYIANARAAKALADAGVRVNNGAHGQLQGLGVHWEMWMLVQGGMTPWEALQASTINGARYIGLDHDLGSLAPGKLADLVVLGKNPLENIQNSDSVELVMLNGRLYDAATMNEIFPGKRKRAPFWWED